MFKAQVIGNLGFDATKRNAKKSAEEYISFSVAHDRGRDVPSVWVNVYWREGVGHRILPYLKKGAKVAVFGDCAIDTYTGRDGRPTTSITIYPDSVDIILFPKREDGAQGASTHAGTGEPACPAYVQNAGPGAQPEAQPQAAKPTGPCPIPTPPGNAAGDGNFFGEHPDDLPF